MLASLRDISGFVHVGSTWYAVSREGEFEIRVCDVNEKMSIELFFGFSLGRSCKLPWTKEREAHARSLPTVIFVPTNSRMHRLSDFLVIL